MAKPKASEKLGDCDTPALTPVSTYGIDYLSSTFKTSTPAAARAAVAAALAAIKIADTVGDQKDRNGFVGADIAGARGFAGTRGELALIDLPGKALEAIRLRGLKDADVLAALALWRASRIDISVDCTNPKITPSLVAQEWHAGRVTCRAGEIRELKQTRSDGRFSHTVYIGSAASMRMMRVYDKRMQMEFVHKVNTERPWTRFELQHRHKEADAACAVMRRDGVAAGLALMNGWITFHDPRVRATREHRKPPAAWWLEVVGAKKARSG